MIHAIAHFEDDCGTSTENLRFPAEYLFWLLGCIHAVLPFTGDFNPQFGIPYAAGCFVPRKTGSDKPEFCTLGGDVLCIKFNYLICFFIVSKIAHDIKIAHTCPYLRCQGMWDVHPMLGLPHTAPPAWGATWGEGSGAEPRGFCGIGGLWGKHLRSSLSVLSLLSFRGQRDE